MDLSSETVIWFIISLAVGILVFGTVTNFDYNKTFDSVNDQFENGREEKENLEKVQENQFIYFLLDFWESCNYGETRKENTIYFNSSLILNETYLTDEIRNRNLCHILGKRDLGCGLSNEINIEDPIELPRVIRLSCDPVLRTLIIE